MFRGFQKELRESFDAKKIFGAKKSFGAKNSYGDVMGCLQRVTGRIEMDLSVTAFQPAHGRTWSSVEGLGLQYHG